MSKIWGLGTAAVDIRITTADYGEGYKDKLLAQKSKWFGGGATSNALVQAKRLGAKVGWLGKIGKDAVGKAILELLQSEDVNCNSVIVDEKCISPFNVAVYAGQNNRRIGGFLLPNSLVDISLEDISKFVENISSDDYVLVEVGEINIDMCIAFCSLVKSKGAMIVIDVDLDPIKQCGASVSQVDELFKLADFLMPNILSLQSLYTDGEPIEMIMKDLFSKYSCNVIATLGEKGAGYVGEGGEIIIIDTINSDDREIIDTVGAGDAFHGGFIYALASGYNLSDSIKLANICGNYNCKTFGPRNGMVDKNSLKKILTEKHILKEGQHGQI